MNNTTLHAIHDQYLETQSLILHVVEGLRHEQWTVPPGNMGAPLAFHVWHIAREADILYALVSEASHSASQQIWDRDHIAERWGFPDESLGLLRTGVGMTEAEAARLPWPSPDILINYLHQAFTKVNAAIASLDEDRLQVVITPRLNAIFGGAGTVERALMSAIANGNRHLGIIGWISTSRSTDRVTRGPLMAATESQFQPANASFVADK